MQETQFHTDEQWQKWLDDLAANDFVYVDNFIPDQHFKEIQHYFESLRTDSEFSKAAIGNSENRQVESSIRGDFIYWLSKERDTPLSEVFALLDELVDRLKQYLLLSISDFEFHFALYPAQTRYKKHIDQFQGTNNRLISVLIYLNEDWQTGDGGELKVYRPDSQDMLIQPLAKRLVMFRSDTVEHEVLRTEVPRKSLTGWLLRKPASLSGISLT
jgi:SM-20-related protein